MFVTKILPYFGYSDRCRYLMLNLSSHTRKLWQLDCEKMIRDYVKRRKMYEPAKGVSGKQNDSTSQILKQYIKHIDSIYLRLLPGIEIISKSEYDLLLKLIRNPQGKYLQFDSIK
mmetsp:Transcript_4074/g.4987  ORF Transcript_4074/g.4987 Transcript_4074/m.4987 type:complete len:115 (-) Transcript_4074:1610-1954(-)